MTRNAQLWRTGAQPLQEGSLASPFSGGDPTRPLTPLQIPFHLWSHLQFYRHVRWLHRNPHACES